MPRRLGRGTGCSTRSWAGKFNRPGADEHEENFKKLERHYDRILSIHVVFHVEKLNQIAEATVHVTKDEIHAHASAENMYTSIDDLVNKLDRQLIKHKEKLDNHRE